MIDQRATSGVIYQITVAGDPRRYIGSAASFKGRKWAHRWMLRSGRHHCLALRAAVRKYGFDATSIVIVETVDGANLIEREQHWLDTFRGRLFNTLTSAIGPAGHKKTAEQAEKSARHHRGKIVSAETRARLSAAMKGNTNGRFTARSICRRGHVITGENIYRYMSKGRPKLVCRKCQDINNHIQHERRYPTQKRKDHEISSH